MDQYLRQKVRTSWVSVQSDYFITMNGIRQGSIASPVLFCIYIDALLHQLKRNGIGCWIGPHYFGVLTYADDITLL